MGIKHYIKLGVSPAEVAAHDHAALTALHEAARHGHEVHAVVDENGNKFFLAIDNDGVPTKAVEVKNV